MRTSFAETLALRGNIVSIVLIASKSRSLFLCCLLVQDTNARKDAVLGLGLPLLQNIPVLQNL